VTVSGPPSDQRVKNGPTADIRPGHKPGRSLRTDNRARSNRPAVQSLFSPRQSPGTLEVSGPSPGSRTRLVQQSTVQPRRPGRRQPTIKLGRQLTQSRASLGQPRTLGASTRATHRVAGSGTCQCGNLQSGPGDRTATADIQARAVAHSVQPGLDSLGRPQTLRASTRANGPEAGGGQRPGRGGLG
jgi:hypothetical protein